MMSPANNSGLTPDQKSKQSRVTNPSTEYAYFKGTQLNGTQLNSKNCAVGITQMLFCSSQFNHFDECQYAEC